MSRQAVGKYVVHPLCRSPTELHMIPPLTPNGVCGGSKLGLGQLDARSDPTVNDTCRNPTTGATRANVHNLIHFHWDNLPYCLNRYREIQLEPREAETTLA